ncbi:VCBS repeat-containing protein, partial [Streptomyces sp. NPDC047097]|uniref:FG-GAP repeat domain-containing protein n=1 Tax=Streptomyces sp. NPDC047097 TaxID=3155260 RepID=UPI0033CB8BAB
MAYVAAIEPFHGNTDAVYSKSTDGPAGEVEWNRVLLDVYGDPNENGEGPGHQIVCADFDGDGEDEFLVALRGPWPWQGVMYYKAIDLKNGVWAKWRVSDDSVARIATADFNGDGRLDFATIAYSVQNYYVAKEAKLMVYRNEIDIP